MKNFKKEGVICKQVIDWATLIAVVTCLLTILKMAKDSGTQQGKQEEKNINFTKSIDNNKKLINDNEKEIKLLKQDISEIKQDTKYIRGQLKGSGIID